MRLQTRMFALMLVASLPQSARAQRSPMDTLAWLAGCWRMPGGTTTVDEHWMAPNGGVMMGMSRTVSGGRVREFEFLRLYAAGDTLVYAANPSGQQPTEFRHKTLSPSEIVFENLANDFPQRIRYRRVSSDLVVAGIEGDKEGRRRPVTFSYERTECTPGQAAAAARADTVGVPTPASVRALLQPKYDALVARETEYFGAVNSWYAEQGDSAFTHVMWTAGGQSVPVAQRATLAGAGENMKNANAGAAFRNRRYTVSLEQLLLRGDTAEILITSNYTWVFADTAGRYGAKGADHERAGTERRIDRWVRSGADWRLRQVSPISNEITVDGKLVGKNGRLVP